MKRALYLAATLTLALAAQAAGSAAPPGANPEATAAYHSTTSEYIPYREGGIADWRQVNDEMGKLRGHAGHGSSNGSGADSGMREQRKDPGARQ
jgi:hypothetical protein